MKRFRTLIALVFLGWVLIALGHAETPPAPQEENNPNASLMQTVLSLHAIEADWAFSGTVNNESGEQYHYFFQLQKSGHHYHGKAALIDGQSKAVLLYEEGESDALQAELTHWQAGNLFLRFNPISNTWVFGLSEKNSLGKKGFNFKIDMLEPAEKLKAKQQVLAQGVEFLMNETGRLNGHFQINESAKEEFVTAQKAWFRQIWVSKPQVNKHALTSVLCTFKDGAAMYALNMPEMDALRGSLAGRRDPEGKSLPISQFISTKEGKDGLWQIKIPPKTALVLENLLDKNESNTLIVGLITQGESGFCAINKALV